jgi:hypothetical protein
MIQNTLGCLDYHHKNELCQYCIHYHRLHIGNFLLGPSKNRKRKNTNPKLPASQFSVSEIESQGLSFKAIE